MGHRPLAAVLAAAAVFVATAVPTAATAAGAGGHTADETGPSAQPARMVLLLDSSGSMAEPAGDGRSKIKDAKAALNAVIGDLPDQASVGLRVFGATVFSRDDRGACSDTQAVVPPATGDRTALRSAVNRYKPYGETPIPAALRAAAKDLGSAGRRSIVLVSDGESTCGDPCATAAAVVRDGIDLRIDVVGLDVAGKSRTQLQCIAKNGHGTYYDAHDAGDLDHALGSSATRASRPFDLTGTTVRGTASSGTAPTLGDGQYVDRLPAHGGRWYRVERPVSGSTVHVGVSHFSNDWGNAGDRVSVKVYADPDGTECGSGMSFPLGRLGNAEAMSWAKDPGDDCNTAATLYVKVEPLVSGMAGDPVQLDVYTEPPLADPTGRDLPAQPPVPHWSTLRRVTPLPGGVPGTSIANAPLLRDGTFSFDINAGEIQVVAVPLDWGQNLQVQLDARLPKDIGDVGPPRVAVSGPLGATTSTDFYGTDREPKDWTTFSPFLGGKRYRTGDQTLTTAYTNRDSVVGQMKGGSIAGLRYVQVSYLGDGDPVDYTLTLKTNGVAGRGAPAYADSPGLHPPTADSALVVGGAARTGSSSGPDPSPSTTGSVDQPGSTGSRPAASADGGGATTPIAIGLGVLGIALLAGAGWLVARRRST